VIDFQLKHKIISSRYEEQAWYFGNKTIAVLKSKYTIDDNIFKEPFVDPADEFDALTRKEKIAIVRLRNKLDVYISKKSKGNKIKITHQKTQLQNKLQKVINKTKNKNKKQKLQYLKIIL
jgi:hypothetical protein